MSHEHDNHEAKLWSEFWTGVSSVEFLECSSEKSGGGGFDLLKYLKLVIGLLEIMGS